MRDGLRVVNGVAVNCETWTRGRRLCRVNKRRMGEGERGREKRVPGPGQGVGIESGDKDRSEVEDLSSKIHPRIFIMG